jgi:archaellum component FlaF (FlaF/FlaG flagellin family)
MFVPQILTEMVISVMLLLTIVTVLMDGSITELPNVFNVLTDVSLVSLLLLLVPLNQMVVTLTETPLQLVHVILDIGKMVT